MRLWGPSWEPRDPARLGDPRKLSPRKFLGSLARPGGPPQEPGRAGLGKFCYGEDRCFQFEGWGCHKLFVPHQILFPIKQTLGDGEAAIRSCGLCVCGALTRMGLRRLGGPPPSTPPVLPQTFVLGTVPGLLSIVQLQGLRAGTQEPWMGVLRRNLALALPSALIIAYLSVTCLPCFPLPSS